MTSHSLLSSPALVSNLGHVLTCEWTLTLSKVVLSEQIELPAKLLDSFLWSNKSNINQSRAFSPDWKTDNEIKSKMCCIMLNCSSHYLPSKVHFRRGTPYRRCRVCVPSCLQCKLSLRYAYVFPNFLSGTWIKVCPISSFCRGRVVEVPDSV